MSSLHAEPSAAVFRPVLCQKEEAASRPAHEAAEWEEVEKEVAPTHLHKAVKLPH